MLFRSLAFDLPAAQVTPQRLHQLYDQHLDELNGAGPALLFDAPLAAPPVAMPCR